MKAKKMNSYKKLGMVMLASAIIGGVIGSFSVGIFLAGGIDSLGHMMDRAMAGLQQVMFPVMAVITVVSVLFGEVDLRKLKAVGRKILETEDEACDWWEYEEEKISAYGVMVNIVSQALCVLVLSAGYSMEYIADSHSDNFLAVCLVFLVCYVYDGFWNVRYIKVIQAAHPEKKGDPASWKFQKQWLESCDEAEKEVIYQSAYKAYIQTNQGIPVLLVITMLGHLLFNTGIMAILVVVVIWIIIVLSYLRSCVSLKGKKIRA